MIRIPLQPNPRTISSQNRLNLSIFNIHSRLSSCRLNLHGGLQVRIGIECLGRSGWNPVADCCVRATFAIATSAQIQYLLSIGAADTTTATCHFPRAGDPEHQLSLLSWSGFLVTTMLLSSHLETAYLRKYSN